MKTSISTPFYLIILTIISLLLGCAPAPTPAPELIQFTQPSPEAMFIVGVPIDISLQITSNKTYSDVYFTVMNTPLSRQAITTNGANPLVVTETWTPVEPGQAVIEAYAVAKDGSVLGPASVTIKVFQPKATPTPTILPIEEETVQSLPTEVPVNQLLTATVPAVDLKLNINVDNDYLLPGDCTMLRWKAEDVDAVFLDGEIVDKENGREICPSETTEYVLEGVRGDGKDTASVLVMVEGFLDDDSVGPEITGMALAPEQIVYGEGCEEASSKFSVSITDESGVLLASLFYRVVSGDQIGEWQEVMLEETDGGVYTYMITAADLDENLESISTGKLEYYVDAMDLLINETKTGTGIYPINPCTTGSSLP